VARNGPENALNKLWSSGEIHPDKRKADEMFYFDAA